MKAFIVFATVIAVAAANAVGRAGWGSGGPSPSIDLELSAAAVAAGAGQAAAQQALAEIASGNNDGPASVHSANGILAAVQQGEDISQVNVANKPSGATSTINAVDVINQAVAVDSLDASLSGANYAAVQNSAATDASGEGAIASDATSLNNVITGQQGQGWKRQ